MLITMGGYINYLLGSLWKKAEEEKSLSEIQESFRGFGSGSVDLSFGEDGIALLVLNNPEKRNAMTGKMMAELCDALEKLEKWKDGKGLLIHGAGLGFCSGADVDFIRNHGTETIGSEISRLLTDALERLAALPLVSVAYVHGVGAIGGGAEIAVAADFRVMSPNSKIGFVHGKMGLTPAWGGASRLVRLVGRERALELLLTARLVSTDEANALGLVERCGDLNFAETFLKNLCVLAPSVIGGIKGAVSGNEMTAWNSLFLGAEHRKALAARIKHS